MPYDPASVAAYFDRFGHAEWDRFDRSLGDRVSFVLHAEALERAVPRGSRVLEVGAGPGRFTEVLHGLGCRVVVADLSATQLALHREFAEARGFAACVEARHQLDICDLRAFEDASYDAVVAFGGPLSYVFEQRDHALAECRRVVRPGGAIAVSVMSLWGTTHRYLEAVLAGGPALAGEIVRTGDLTATTSPGSTHHCHMYRAAELRALLDAHDLVDVELSASSALSTGVASSVVAADSPPWLAVLALERVACAEPGYLDAGTHLLGLARRPAAG